MAALAPGSYLALSHATGDKLPPRQVGDVMDTLERNAIEFYGRPRAEVERFFSGLELVPPHEGAPPAISYTGLWGAEDLEAADTDGSRAFYCAVGRRPEGFAVWAAQLPGDAGPAPR